MNRRLFFSSIAAIGSPAVAATATGAPGSVRHIRLDYSQIHKMREIYGDKPDSESNMPELRLMRSHQVLLNGRQVKSPWFVDTEAGVAASYDVLPEGACVNGPKDGYKRFDAGPPMDDGKSGLRRDIYDVTRFTPWEECDYSPADFHGREVVCTPGEVMYEILRGKVQIVHRDTGELLYGKP